MQVSHSAEKSINQINNQSINESMNQSIDGSIYLYDYKYVSVKLYNTVNFFLKVKMNSVNLYL